MKIQYMIIKWIIASKLLIGTILSILLINSTNPQDLLAQSSNSISNVKERITNQSNVIENTPHLSVYASCAVGSSDIPGQFNARGFPPNEYLLIDINKSNSTFGQHTEPVSLIYKALTDLSGTVNGTFTLHTEVEPPNYGKYYLHVSEWNNSEKSAIASLDIC
jgi:hypothetical protein